MKRISILVVTYGVDLCDSLSLKSIQSLDLSCIDFKPELKIWMNKFSGEKTYLENKIHEKFEVEIIKSKENKSLPLVYNEFLLEQQSDYGILFDQDSIVEAGYISEIYKAIHETNAKLLLPKVVHSNILVSPGRLRLFFGSLDSNLKDIVGIVNDRNLVAINSGLVVKVQLVKDGMIRYDERLRFYFTDTKFLLDYNKLDLDIYLLKSIITHDLSELSDSNNVSRACVRFNDMILGFRSVYPSGIRKALLEIYLMHVAIRYSIRFKSIDFFRILVG